MGLIDYLRSSWGPKAHPHEQEGHRPENHHDVAEAPPPEAAPQAEVETSPAAAPDDELDVAFDAILDDGSSADSGTSSAPTAEYDQSSARQLFAEIAANHARPVKSFIMDLKRGVATTEWIEVCRPIMALLIKGAESTGLAEAARRMVDFDEALSLAAAAGESTIEPAAQDLLLTSYQEMAAAFPEVFGQDDADLRRDSMIIQSLLRQIPGVGHVTFKRLFAAGLNTLAALYLARQDELAVTTGIPLSLCGRICEQAQEHRRRADWRRAESGQKPSREPLRKLVKELRRLHEAYERAWSADWSRPAIEDERRELRGERQLCTLRIMVELTDIGELELAEEIQKMSSARRTETLEQFVASPALATVGA